MSFLDDVDRRESILLDVLNENCHYEEVVNLPIEGPFLKIDGIPNVVNVPSVGDILGDKLTAYAPNTTGIPYIKRGNDCSMEIIKQLYDVARLFEEVKNLEVTSKSFGRIAEVELSYRGMEISICCNVVLHVLNRSCSVEAILLTMPSLMLLVLRTLQHLPSRLRRLKRQSPEAFFYWAKISELLSE